MASCWKLLINLHSLGFEEDKSKMAAKFLHALTDDSPDLQKNIGCMAGLFQLFDRNHVLINRRTIQKRLPPGHSRFNNGNLVVEPKNSFNQQNSMISSKGADDRQKVFSDSPIASFSSSPCTSSSSLIDCNKMTQPSPSSNLDHHIFPETPSRDQSLRRPNSSSHLSRSSLDLRDIVEDSMYKEAHGMFRDDVTTCGFKEADFPITVQPSKSMTVSYGKQNVTEDLEDSSRSFSRLGEATYCINETKELPRSSCDAKGRYMLSIPKDVRRFSCDGREINHFSGHSSRDHIRSTARQKELPRLSLDGTEGFKNDCNSNSKSSHLLRNFHKVLDQSGGPHKRPPGVVAKLMGLETLPISSLVSDPPMELIRASPSEDCDAFLSSRENDPIQFSEPRRSSRENPTSSKWKNHNPIKRPVSSSRCPIELAPWKQSDGNLRDSPNSQSRLLRGEPSTLPSVYGKERLKVGEVQQSEKDLQALQLILEAMHAKVVLETSRAKKLSELGVQRDNVTAHPNMRLMRRHMPQSERMTASRNRGASASRKPEAPIVIIKPAKLMKNSGIPASSVIPMNDIAQFFQVNDGESTESLGGLANDHIRRDRRPIDNQICSSDKKANIRNLRSTHCSTRAKENGNGLIESSGSISPRVQQKKLDLERQSRLHVPSDSSKSRPQFRRQVMEPSSLGGKLRSKSSKLQHSDDLLSEVSSDYRTLNNQGDSGSVNSDSNTNLLDSLADVGVTSPELSAYISGSQSLSRTPRLYQKESIMRLSEIESPTKLASNLAIEHASPVSVLDVSVDRDEPLSPVKQVAHAFKVGECQKINGNCNEEQWDPDDNFQSCPNSMSRKKLRNIENLVQKLRRLNSSHDETSTDYIASLCENLNPDHRYISEILLASGLLLRDLSSSTTNFQLHPSGHLINPELFFVLELTKNRKDMGNLPQPKSDPKCEKFHRKLIFDAVNEILVGKLVSPKPSHKLAREDMSAQKLLRELCLDIQQLQPNRSVWGFEDGKICDGLKSILLEDMMVRSGSWIDFHCEVPDIVLGVERLIFRDLVDEMVMVDAAGLPGRQRRHCRKLFAKK